MPWWNKITEKWVGQIKYKKRKYQSAHKTKNLAKKWEVKKREELEKEAVTIQIPMVSLLEFATKYLDYSKNQHSEKTYKEKQHAYKQLFNSFDSGLDVADLTIGDVLRHLQEQSESRTGNAANKQRKNLIAGWHWGQKYLEGFPGNNPFMIDRFPEIRHPRYIPPEEDFWKVHSSAENHIDSVMLLSYLHLAARRNEIFTLRIEDVDLNLKQVRLYTRKRKDGSLEFDWLPLTKRLYAEYNKIIKDSDSEWMFPNPLTEIPYFKRQHWLPRLCEKAKVKRFGIHAIRHLSASILSENDISLIDIQTILRHKKLTTTERYIHRLKSVRSALDVF
jgi:integrase